MYTECITLYRNRKEQKTLKCKQSNAILINQYKIDLSSVKTQKIIGHQ